MNTIDLSQYIRIVNRTGSIIKARYDSVDYVFVPDEPTDVHELAAAHIFGYGVDDKIPAFHRLGWLNHMSLEMCIERVKDIDFDDVPAPAVDIAPGKKRKKTGSPTPLADAGAEGGDGGGPSPPDAAKGRRAEGDLM
jgi:hypothetical protein